MVDLLIQEMDSLHPIDPDSVTKIEQIRLHLQSTLSPPSIQECKATSV